MDALLIILQIALGSFARMPSIAAHTTDPLRFDQPICSVKFPNVLAFQLSDMLGYARTCCYAERSSGNNVSQFKRPSIGIDKFAGLLFASTSILLKASGYL